MLPVEGLSLDETEPSGDVEVKIDLLGPLVNELGGVEDDEGRKATLGDEVQGDDGFADTARELQDSATRPKKSGHGVALCSLSSRA